MFFWIISAFLSSFSTIFWKKSISGDQNISSVLIYFLWCFSYLLIALYYLLLTETSLFLDVKVILLSILVIVLWIVQNHINQKVYKVEKISTLTPYSNLNKVLIIVFSFLFLKDDISKTSFFITLLTSFIIIFSAVDFKNLSISNNVKLFIFNQFLLSIRLLIIAYLVIKLSSIDYFIIDSILATIFSLFLVIYLKEFKSIFKLWSSFYKFSFVSSLFWALAYLLSLFIIWELWMVMNILISFVYLAFILILSYIFFQDKPMKKDILLSIIILWLVSLWVYFK